VGSDFAAARSLRWASAWSWAGGRQGAARIAAPRSEAVRRAVRGHAKGAERAKGANTGSPANLYALRGAASRCTAAQGAKRLVALTFDDGPGPYTKFAIDELGRAHARAPGSWSGATPANAARLPEEQALGELADHTWTHPALTGLSAEAAASEIQRTRDAVAAAAGRPTRLFRPPTACATAGSTTPSTTGDGRRHLERGQLDSAGPTSTASPER